MAEKEEQQNQTKPAKLNARQEAFIKYYSVCNNGSEAARRAGYSAHSADVIAVRLLGNARIKNRILREQEYTFDTWCKEVKGIIHDESAWQAKFKGLELYGKARGWLRESLITNNFLGINQEDIEKLRKSISFSLKESDNSSKLIENNAISA